MSGGLHRRTLALAAATLVLGGTLAGAALAASTDFTEPSSSPVSTGDLPIAIASGDFDADGDADLATANFFDDNVTVLKNGGSGDFFEAGASPEAVPASPTPRAIVGADFDGDGDGDLAVGADFPTDVTILRSNGAGNFTEPGSSPEATAGAFALTKGDLDGDGDPDLVAADPQSENLTILKNNGSGNFTEAGSSPETGGVTPTSIEAADFDGDGDPDLVAAGQSHPDLTVLRNNGAGNFTELGSSPETAGDQVHGVVAADLDGDNDQDLVATGGAGEVNVLNNNGGGNFTEANSSPEAVGTAPRAIAAGDFDADGDSDLAVSNPGSNDATILRNNGVGNFSEPASSPEFFVGVVAMVTADLDGDADPDLAGASQFDLVRILLNL